MNEVPAYQEWAEIYNPRRTQKGYEAFLCAVKMKNQRENLMIKALEEILKDLKPYTNNEEL